MANEEEQQQSTNVQVGSDSPVEQQQQDNSYLNSLGYVLSKKHMRYDPICIVFTILILVGGLIGYFTKGSLPSLIAGIVFFILLAISTYVEGALKNPWPLLIVLASLASMFLYRYYASGNFMPSGLFSILSLIMLLRHGYLYRLRRQSNAI